MDMNTMKQILVADSVDRLINIDFHAKGLYSIYNSVRKIVGMPLTYVAAKGLIERLAGKKDSVALIGTGFLIDPYKKPETDGVIGAPLLARGLDLAFGTTSIIVCEHEAVETLKWTCNAAELSVCDDLATAIKNPNSVCIIPISKDIEQAKEESDRLMKMLKPEVMISVERPGSNPKGIYHSAVGYNINHKVAKIDYLFEMVREKGGFTVGIGDLGNELGVGNAYDELSGLIAFGAKCKCGCGSGTVTNKVSSAPLIGMSSEIAVYGLLAVLKEMTGKDVLHSSRLQRHILVESVMHGAVDGQTGRPSATIDVMTSESIERIVDLLHDVLYHSEKHTNVRPEFLEYVTAQAEQAQKQAAV